MDNHTKAQRSYNMSQIRSKNTKPERIIVKILRKKGYSFRRYYSIPGKPDIAFPKHKVAVFIDGEFWHGRHFVEWSNKLKKFWFEKILSNIKRDRKNDRKLRNLGWHVLHAWDKDIIHSPEKTVNRMIKKISKH
jgi:DNA mismatch endonuclease (patch repair protein)